MKWRKCLAALLIAALLLPAAALAQGNFNIAVDINPRAADADKPITVTAFTTDGTAPVNYTFSWRCVEWDEVYYVLEETNTTGISTLPRPFGTSGWVEISAVDALGRQSNWVQLDFMVNGSIANPIYCKVTVDKETIQAGDEITGQVLVSGGVPPYSYYYIWEITEGNLTQRFAGVASTTYTNKQVIPYGNKGHLSLGVSDSVGRTAHTFPSTEAYFTIMNSQYNPLDGSVAVNKAQVGPGVPFTVSVQPSGGEPPYRYLYSFDYGDPDFLEDIQSESPSLTHSLERTEDWNITVTVRDAFNRERILTTGIKVVLQRGDANGDLVVDIMDLVSIIQYIVDKANPPSLLNADANSDGIIDILDLVRIIEILVGK